MSKITLYDLASRNPCRCWSPNPWKTRLLLNFKQLPYETKWLEYPDIAPTLQKLGLKPNDPSSVPTPYTSPAITMPDGTHVMDSIRIAEHVEKAHPEPSARVSDPTTAKTFTAVTDLFTTMRPIIIPRVPRLILNPASVEYFTSTREQRLGMSLEDFESTQGGESAWSAAQPHLKNIASLLHADSSGPFILGAHPCYADLILAGFLQFCVRAGQGGNDIFDRIVEADAVYGRFYEAVKPWLERDDH